MWRPAHGATSRPGPSRPAGGYGRASGRPGPGCGVPTDDEPALAALEPEEFGDVAASIWPGERPVEVGGVDAPAPVTP